MVLCGPAERIPGGRAARIAVGEWHGYGEVLGIGAQGSFSPTRAFLGAWLVPLPLSVDRSQGSWLGFMPYAGSWPVG